MEFNKCVNHLIDVTEGAYLERHGKETFLTKFGIDQPSHKDVDVPNLQRHEAIEIYKNTYWNPLRLEDLPFHVRYMGISCAVNCGNATTIKLLQKVLGVDRDGVIGNSTLSAAKKRDSIELAKAFLMEWRSLYIRIAIAKDYDKIQYLLGWINRTQKVFDFIFDI